MRYAVDTDGSIRLASPPASTMAGDDSTISTDWRIVDAVDDEWASETLPDDGARARIGPRRAQSLRSRRWCGLTIA